MYQNEQFDKELICLSKNVYFEARNQSIAGKMAVIFVTLNRVKSNKFPNTVCDVVWQRKQFSWTHDGKSDVPYEHDEFNEIKALAYYILKSPGAYVDITNGSLFYHASYVKPIWISQMTQTVVIDDHIFYKRKK